MLKSWCFFFFSFFSFAVKQSIFILFSCFFPLYSCLFACNYFDEKFKSINFIVILNLCVSVFAFVNTNISTALNCFWHQSLNLKPIFREKSFKNGAHTHTQEKNRKLKKKCEVDRKRAIEWCGDCDLKINGNRNRNRNEYEIEVRFICSLSECVYVWKFTVNKKHTMVKWHAMLMRWKVHARRANAYTAVLPNE